MSTSGIASGNSIPVTADTAARIVTALAGAALAAPLVWRRSWWTAAGAVAGAALVYRSVAKQTDGRQSATASSQRVITIGKNSDELYALWRNPEAFRAILRDVAQAAPRDNGHTHWLLRLPHGHTAEWETETVEDRPGELFHWRSLPGSLVENEGCLSMKPAPQGRGTEVTLALSLNLANLPGGKLLQGLSKVSEAIPRAALNKVLRNFKSFAETGETPTLDRNPSGRAPKNENKGDLV